MPTERERISVITFNSKLADRIIAKMYQPDMTEEHQNWLEDQLAQCENNIAEQLGQIAIDKIYPEFTGHVINIGPEMKIDPSQIKDPDD